MRRINSKLCVGDYEKSMSVTFKDNGADVKDIAYSVKAATAIATAVVPSR